MKKAIIVTLIVLGVLAVAGGIFFAKTAYARADALGLFAWSSATGAKGTAYVPTGRMAGYGYGRSMDAQPGYGPGAGMMNGQGVYGRGAGMMAGNRYNNANLIPLTVDQAKTAAEKYLADLNNPDLKIAEIMIFDNNAYVLVKEASTGRGAFELLVDSQSQIAYPEHGPNMMWNLKYGALNHENMHEAMMGGYGRGAGMMGAWNNNVLTDVSAEMTITPQQAIQVAQKYLDANISGATAATDPAQFYGYYTLDYEKGGKVAGMLSVNGFTGQVFLHTWHGSFIEESTLE